MPIIIEDKSESKTDDSGNPLNPRDKDNQASRIGKGVGEANTKQAEVTTREDQVKVNV